MARRPTRRKRVAVPDGADQDVRCAADPRRYDFEELGVGQIAPGHEPELAELGTAVHDVLPTAMVYQSAVRDGDGEFTFRTDSPMEDR